MKPLPSSDLEVIGEALYGPRWRSEIARHLGVPLRTFMRWLSDGTSLDVEHVAVLRMLVRSRLARLEEARKLLWSSLEDR
jgi:hypothetical protein